MLLAYPVLSLCWPRGLDTYLDYIQYTDSYVIALAFFCILTSPELAHLPDESIQAMDKDVRSPEHLELNYAFEIGFVRATRVFGDADQPSQLIFVSRFAWRRE